MSGVGIDQEWLAAWVQESCAAQGVPVKVSDPVVVDRVGVLLGVAAGGRRAHGAAAPSTHPPQASQPPDRADAARVQPACAGGARADDRVVQQRRDDRRLPFQVQLGPAFA